MHDILVPVSQGGARSNTSSCWHSTIQSLDPAPRWKAMPAARLLIASMQHDCMLMDSHAAADATFICCSSSALQGSPPGHSAQA